MNVKMGRLIVLYCNQYNVYFNVSVTYQEETASRLRLKLQRLVPIAKKNTEGLSTKVGNALREMSAVVLICIANSIDVEPEGAAVAYSKYRCNVRFC